LLICQSDILNLKIILVDLANDVKKYSKNKKENCRKVGTRKILKYFKSLLVWLLNIKYLTIRILFNLILYVFLTKLQSVRVQSAYVSRNHSISNPERSVVDFSQKIDAENCYSSSLTSEVSKKLHSCMNINVSSSNLMQVDQQIDEATLSENNQNIDPKYLEDDKYTDGVKERVRHRRVGKVRFTVSLSYHPWNYHKDLHCKWLINLNRKNLKLRKRRRNYSGWCRKKILRGTWVRNCWAMHMRSHVGLLYSLSWWVISLIKCYSISLK